MKLDRIHCLVVHLPPEGETDAKMPAAEELLPWADPYIVGLIQKLNREAEASRASGCEIQFDDECFDFDLEIDEVLSEAEAVAGASSQGDIVFGFSHNVRSAAEPAFVRLPR